MERTKQEDRGTERFRKERGKLRKEWKDRKKQQWYDGGMDRQKGQSKEEKGWNE